LPVFYYFGASGTMVVVRAGAICLNPGGSILAQFVPIFVLAN